MTTMLNVITRLGLPGNSTLENRYLSVDIASTLFYWDHLATREAAQAVGDLQVKQEAEQTLSGAASGLQPAADTIAVGDAEQASR